MLFFFGSLVLLYKKTDIHCDKYSPEPSLQKCKEGVLMQKQCFTIVFGITVFIKMITRLIYFCCDVGVVNVFIRGYRNAKTE